MKTKFSALLLVTWAPFATAAPIAITCNGSFLEPTSGRPIGGQLITFGFEFDQQTQTMSMTEGSETPAPMNKVVVTSASAKGVLDDKWVYEVNRIEGTATVRAIDGKSLKYGLTGNYYRGTCAPTGTARF